MLLRTMNSSTTSQFSKDQNQCFTNWCDFRFSVFLNGTYIGIHCTVIFFFIRICCNILSGISKSGQKIDLFYHLGPYIRVNNNYIVIRDVLHMIRALTDLFKLLGALVLHHYFRVITDENFCSNSFTKIFFLILPSSCYLFEVWSVTKQCMAWGMMKWGFFSVEFRELGEIIKTQCSQINEKV